jgi:hypothetical protein
MKKSVIELDRRAVAWAALAFGLVAPTAYLVQRLYEIAASGGNEISPAMILRSNHVGFFFRAATAAWWAGLFAVFAYLLARRGDGSPRLMRIGVWGLALAWLFVAWRFP